MGLAVPIELEQIAAARRLHQRLDQWQSIDKALASLALQFPGFSLEESLLKATCVNALYGTNVLAIHRLAKHITEVLKNVDLISAGPELVEELAVPPRGHGKVHRHHSFASKFAHFFIDSERFPIKDSYAVEMVKFHLGLKSMEIDPKRPYVAFWKNHRRLKEELSFSVSNPDLDHYLWIAGLYMKYRKNTQADINREVHDLFANGDTCITADLADLVPNITYSVLHSHG
ncbi:MAG: hypothetical protein ACRD50_02845 [Candidatus Acidiferrales bacterium]